MKCLVRTEHGVCRQGAVDLVPIVLPTHDYLNFIEEAKLKEIPVCATHAKWVEDGWKLKGSLMFWWVPPDGQAEAR